MGGGADPFKKPQELGQDNMVLAFGGQAMGRRVGVSS